MYARFRRGMQLFSKKNSKLFNDINALEVLMSLKFFALHTEGMFLSFQESAFSFLGENATLKLPAAFDSAEKSELVGVLNVSSDGDTVGKTGDLNAGRLDKTAYVHSGGLALNGGVGGDHDLFGAALLDALGKRENIESVGAFAASGRDNSAQNVINTVKLLDLLKGDDSLGILDHTDQLSVALGI